MTGYDLLWPAMTSYDKLCPDLTSYDQSSELEIVVELGNLVPRNYLALQKVSGIFRYSQSKTTKFFL